MYAQSVYRYACCSHINSFIPKWLDILDVRCGSVSICTPQVCKLAYMEAVAPHHSVPWLNQYEQGLDVVKLCLGTYKPRGSYWQGLEHFASKTGQGVHARRMRYTNWKCTSHPSLAGDFGGRCTNVRRHVCKSFQGWDWIGLQYCDVSLPNGQHAQHLCALTCTPACDIVASIYCGVYAMQRPMTMDMHGPSH
jgi:hypothetical protein